MKSVYLLPHFDDEVFVIPKIRQDLADCNEILILFFMTSDSRSKESLSFLQKLGISADSVIFIGEKVGAKDGELVNFLPEFYSHALEMLNSVGGEIEIIAPAYEGGHQDHDAISYLGRMLALKWRCKFLEFFLYHGYGTPGRIYKVSSPLAGFERKKYPYKLRDLFTLLKVPFYYKSQLSAMLGLWPFLIVKAIFFPLVLRQNNNQSLLIDEHRQIPLYERWKRISQQSFLTVARRFESKISSVKE